MKMKLKTLNGTDFFLDISANALKFEQVDLNTIKNEYPLEYLYLFAKHCSTSYDPQKAKIGRELMQISHGESSSAEPVTELDHEVKMSLDARKIISKWMDGQHLDF